MEDTTKRNKQLDMVLSFFLIIGMSGWRLWRTFMLHDLDYVREVLYPTPFIVVVLYILFYSASFIFFQKRNHIVFINGTRDDKSFGGYMVARFLLIIVFCGGIFENLFHLLIQWFDFSLLWYGTALILTIFMTLSLQKIVDALPDPPKSS